MHTALAAIWKKKAKKGDIKFSGKTKATFSLLTLKKDGKVAGANQYDSSSASWKTSKRVSHPTTTPPGNKSTSRSSTIEKMEICEPGFGWLIDERPGREHTTSYHELDIDWPMATLTPNGDNFCSKAWELTGVWPEKTNCVENMEILLVSSRNNPLMLLVQDDGYISCAFHSVPTTILCTVWHASSLNDQRQISYQKLSCQLIRIFKQLKKFKRCSYQRQMIDFKSTGTLHHVSEIAIWRFVYSCAVYSCQKHGHRRTPRCSRHWLAHHRQPTIQTRSNCFKLNSSSHYNTIWCIC